VLEIDGSMSVVPFARVRPPVEREDATKLNLHSDDGI
jgi:hypothetical protein